MSLRMIPNGSCGNLTSLFVETHKCNRPVTGIRSCLRVLVGIFTSQPGFQHLCRRCLRWKPGTGPFLAGLGKPLPLAQITSLITGWAGRDLRTDSRWERNQAPSGNLAVISTCPSSSNLSNHDIKYKQLRIQFNDLCLFRLRVSVTFFAARLVSDHFFFLAMTVVEQSQFSLPTDSGALVFRK
jgi:hypothetical protein